MLISLFLSISLQLIVRLTFGNIVDTSSFIFKYMKSQKTNDVNDSVLSLSEMLDVGLRKHAQKDYEGAVESFNNLLSLYPEHFDGLYNLGVVWQDAGNIVNAIKYYEAALKSNPMDHRSRLNLATVYHQRSDVNTAIYHYRFYKNMTMLVPNFWQQKASGHICQ